MGQYSKAIITAAGQSLIARAIAGEAQLNITKAKTSDYKYPDDTDYKALTDMEGIKQVLEFPETKVLENDLIQTRVLFGNEEINATYYIQNIGLYVNDGTKEVLFCIVTADVPDEMPQYNGVAATSYIYNIQNVVKDAATIHITVSPAGNATIQDVMDRVDGTGGDISETVIETLEPIDIKYPVPSAGESTKVFMGKVTKYIEDTKPLDADMFVYVATTGSNTTGDGTSSKPYKTITYAFSQIPKILNGFTASVVISEGTYNEYLIVSGYTGNLELLLDGNVTVSNGISVIGAYVTCRCVGNATYTLTAKGIKVANHGNLSSLSNVNVFTTGAQDISSSSASLQCTLSSLLYMTGIVTMAGNTDVGVFVTGSSEVHFGTIVGTGLNVGIYSSDGCKVSYRKINISANNVSVVGNSSIIVSPYGATIGTLSSDVNLYVATTGSDTTGDGTLSKPYRTIQFAINSIPKDLGGYNATVNIADGIYDEHIIIKGFHNGVLYVHSGDHADVTSLNSNCKVHSMEIKYCSYVQVEGITFVNTNSTTIVVWDSLLRMFYCQSTDINNGGLFCYLGESQGYFNRCRCLNTTTILSAQSSKVFSHEWFPDSSSSTAFILVNGSDLTRKGVQPIGQINSGSGRVFNDNGTQISNMITGGLFCTWGTVQGGYVRNGNLVGTAMVSASMVIGLTTALTANQIYRIYGLPMPSMDIGLVATPQSIVYDCYIKNSGGASEVLYIPERNLPAGTQISISGTYMTVI